MTGLEHAILGLQQALDSPRRHHMWRWLVRHRMAAVRDALTSAQPGHRDAWLAARETSLERERALLVARVSELGPRVLDAVDVEPIRAELRRLVVDLERHRQHLNDLVYDAVSLELGGSE
jgi:hypothetical protein